MTFYEELEWRGLVNQISSPDLIEKLNKGGLTFYIGTDPTADSLHLGHYSSFLITRRMKEHGHHPILLVGLATGLIGDPRGTVERELKQKEEVFRNYDALRAQVEKVFGFEVVNNYDWINGMNVIDFFRDYGKYINVGYMLTKDHVRRQMESGISYAEFSYMLIQAIDFKHLHETRGVDLQVAGSDQWGNITTGIELIRKTTGDEVYALTMPLVTDAQGNKFGKSEGNALWLDKEKTSSYELYQFLLNSDDACVITYLKRLTFLTPEEIMEIEARHSEHPEQRIAQKALAREIITDLHGAAEFEHAVEVSEKLFAGDFKSLSARDIKSGMKNVPQVTLTAGPLADALVAAKVCSSKREAREFIGNGAISINGEVVKDATWQLTPEAALEGGIVIIRRGKKKFYMGEFA
ncbi:MAG: tyrosine--tRNA ligase [Akkermansia sp.]|nr:tyrosine--tRNA ligase [Akkermansia sp.]MBQ2869744.1 tyrosine--tRNA ligase [Akkermansia sp.]MBQ8376818.1 tyrosine--tRNA ligase [Akkermansia sp.]